MSNEGKTHYKSFFNSTFLNDGDFDSSRDTVCTIARVVQVEDETRDGKQMFNAVLLEGYSKPMKAPNEVLKAIKKALNAEFVEDWQGKQISVYILKGLRAFGGVHDVPRIRPVAPRIVIDIEPAKAQLGACKSLDDLRGVFMGLPNNIQSHPAIIKLKDDIKGSLS